MFVVRNLHVVSMKRSDRSVRLTGTSKVTLSIDDPSKSKAERAEYSGEQGAYV